MPFDRRLIQERTLAYRAMREYTGQVGQDLAWFRFNPNLTTSHPVYDVGPQRVWYNPVTVPALIGQYIRPSKNLDADGLYLAAQAHGTISYEAFVASGIPDPDPSEENHLNDRVGFDGHLFTVMEFTPVGRVASAFLTIAFVLHEVDRAIYEEDAAVPMFAPYITAV